MTDPVFIGAVIESGIQSGANVVSKAAPEERVDVMCLDKEGYVITLEEMCVNIFVFELDKREVLTIARDARETPLQEGEK